MSFTNVGDNIATEPDLSSDLLLAHLQGCHLKSSFLTEVIDHLLEISGRWLEAWMVVINLSIFKAVVIGYESQDLPLVIRDEAV